VYIGIDDTDSNKGMCTTYLALELVKEFQSELDLIRYPRLVRLNPNIPWKTRGNGAICLQLARGIGPRKKIGELDGEPVWMWSRAKKETGLVLKEALWRTTKLIERMSHLKADGTNSAVVVTPYKPRSGLYWRTVREVVSKREVRAYLPKGAMVKEYNNGRGVIGASAAISWRPRDKTYEVLAYREPVRWGTRRKVDIDDVKRLDKRFPSTFNNYDIRNRHPAIIPGSPCPILFGIRGDDPIVLPKALSSIGSETKDRWVIFETNQGTDDHMVPRKVLERYQSGIIKGIVSEAPYDIKGGHVLFRIVSIGPRDDYTCAAYEPTKEFRNIVRALLPGDAITVHGSRGATHPDTVSIEKIQVNGLVKAKVKVANPKCPVCKRSMKSMGRGTGFKCRRCGIKKDEREASYQVRKRSLHKTIYEVPIGARRHLSRPLRRT